MRNFGGVQNYRFLDFIFPQDTLICPVPERPNPKISPFLALQ